MYLGEFDTNYSIQFRSIPESIQRIDTDTDTDTDTTSHFSIMLLLSRFSHSQTTLNVKNA